jgi:hypothetical protein
MKRWAMLLGVLAGTALAAERTDFAWQWSLPLDGEAGLVALDLDASVYPHIQRADLRDLAAFNGAGEMIPLMPIHPPSRARERPGVEPVAVPWFRIPGKSMDGEERISLLIARGDDGRLSRLQAEVSPAGEAASGVDILIDLSAFEDPLGAIAFEFDLAPGASLNARVDVEGSDDLSRWRRLGNDLALVDLSAGEARLQRHRLLLPSTRVAYLRVRRTDSVQPLPVGAVAALQVEASPGVMAPLLQELVIEGDADATQSGVFVYRSDGPFPVRQANLRLADRQGIATVVLSSRADDSQAWRQRARFTAFQIESGSDIARNLPVDIGAVRDREWQVQTEPAQLRAPTLELAYVPDRFLLMPQGEGPFLLAAGSVRAERPHYPLQPLLSDLRAARGKDWQPPAIELGPGMALAGDAALQAPPEPLPLRRWLLWGVLVVAAGLLLVMVTSLLREPRS